MRRMRRRRKKLIDVGESQPDATIAAGGAGGVDDGGE